MEYGPNIAIFNQDDLRREKVRRFGLFLAGNNGYEK